MLAAVTMKARSFIRPPQLSQRTTSILKPPLLGAGTRLFVDSPLALPNSPTPC